LQVNRPRLVNLESATRALLEAADREAPAADLAEEPAQPSKQRRKDDSLSKLERLGDLKEKGLITDAEYDEQKKKRLARL
jgi:hypothetical protein